MNEEYVPIRICKPRKNSLDRKKYRKTQHTGVMLTIVLLFLIGLLVINIVLFRSL